MDLVESQQRAVEAVLSTAFAEWRSQLRTKLEECHVLGRELETSNEDVQLLRQRHLQEDELRQDNGRLERELKTLQTQDGSEGGRESYQELERERDALLEDNRTKQLLIDQLQKIVRTEKRKSKSWLLHAKSSPSSTSDRTNSPAKPLRFELSKNPKTLQGAISTLSNQQLLQKLTTPLENGPASPTSTRPSINDNDSSSVPNNPNDKDVSTTGFGEETGPRLAFPDFDLDSSLAPDQSSPQLPTAISPRPPPSPDVHQHAELSIDGKESEQHLPDPIASDSTAPPSQTFQNQEPLGVSSFDLPEVVAARSIGRRLQKSNQYTPVRKSALLAGSAEQPVTVKSEPPESFQDTSVTTFGAATNIPEDLPANCSDPAFASPKRARSQPPQFSNLPGSIVRIASDETPRMDDQIVLNEVLYMSGHNGFRGPSNDRVSKPLQEIKNYERILPRTSNNLTPAAKKRKSSDGRGVAAIPFIAEDGEDHNRNHKTIGNKSDKLQVLPQPTNSVFKRLGDLLAEPSPARQALLRPSSRSTNMMDGYLLNAATSVDDTDKNRLHAMRLNQEKSWKWYEAAESLLQSLDSPYPPRGPKKAPEKIENTTPNTSAKQEPPRQFLPTKRSLAHGPEDDEPIRSRPIHRLSLADFKINTATNAGTDFAYTDVVRSRDQRKCLPGCTRDCCRSKFAAIAATLPKPAIKKRFLDSDPLDGDQSDDDLLADFLGTCSEEKIRSLTPLARENLLQEARTKVAADKYGKMHRFAHERARTPPGFWRTEMPGTQEEEEDRQNARKRDREEVERRYRDACREGGRWVFADE